MFEYCFMGDTIIETEVWKHEVFMGIYIGHKRL